MPDRVLGTEGIVLRSVPSLASWLPMPSTALQHQLRRRATDHVGAELLLALRPDVWASLRSLGHIWLTVCITFWLGAKSLQLPLPMAVLSLAVLGAFMATRINALNVLVHEGSHRCLARSRWVNTLLCNGAAGYWILIDEAAYRVVHSLHHQHLNEASDPDRPLYMVPNSRTALLRAALVDLSGWSALRRAHVYAGRKGAGPCGPVSHAMGKIAAQLCLLTCCSLVFGPPRGLLLYAVLWAIPMVCVFPLIIRLRIATEHFAPELAEQTKGSLFVSRTTRGGRLERYLLGAQMELHFEHHLFPSVPTCHLPRLRLALDTAGFFDSGAPLVREHTLSSGYLKFWRRLWHGPHLNPRVDS